MVAKKKQSKSWGHLIKRPMTKAEKKSFISAVTSNSEDRSVALILGAFLEQSLEEAIKSRLVKMKKNQADELFESGPLRSIESKIKMCRALGILSHRAALTLFKFKQIRNAFAHTVHNVKFSTPRIRNACMSLGRSEKGFDPPIWKNILKGRPFNMKSAKDRYIFVAFAFWIVAREHGTRPSRPRRSRQYYSKIFAA